MVIVINFVALRSMFHLNKYGVARFRYNFVSKRGARGAQEKKSVIRAEDH